MENLMQILTTLSAVVIAAAAVFAAAELRGLRHLLEETVYQGHTSRTTGDGSGHAIFICKQGHWILAADMSGPGYRASHPTTEPSFEGQVVKCASVSD